MAQQIDPRDVVAVVVVEAVTADGRITYELADVIDGVAVEGVLRYALRSGSVVDRSFTVPAPVVAVR